MGAAMDGKASAKQTTTASFIEEEVIVDWVVLVVVVVVADFANAMGCFDDGTSRGNPEIFYTESFQ